MVILPPLIHLVSMEFLAQRLLLAAPDFVIDGYPEYETDAKKLDADQKYMLHKVASAIVRSFGDATHVCAVLIVGHADVAHKVAPVSRAQFEQGISVKRANSAAIALRKRMQELSKDAHFTKVIPFRALGKGSKKLRFLTARTEAEMRMNRRVEFTFGYVTEPGPHCGT